MSVHPNIVVLVSHDSGAHFGCYGAATVATPAIDGLAAGGVRLTHCFASAPICSPSRGALLTGCWPQRNGLMGLAGGTPGGPFGWELSRPRDHLSHVLRDQGYETVLFGHQHETDAVQCLGFDRVSAYLAPGSREGLTAPVIGVACREFLEHRGHQDRPLYLQVGFFETHTPFDHGGVTPDDRLGAAFPAWSDAGELTPEQRAHAAAYQGAAASLDRGVAQIIEGLHRAGMDHNTLLLFTSDHGPEFPMGKWSLYDGGLRVAAVLRWPARGWRGGRTVEALVPNVDLMPSLLSAAGLPLPEGMDGQDVSGLLDGRPGAGRDAVFAMFVGQRFGMRRRDRLLICNVMGSLHAPHAGENAPANPALELYDLAVDPLARRNLAYAPEWRDERRQLSADLVAWLRAVDDPVLRGMVTGPGPAVVPANQRWRDGVGQLIEDAAAAAIVR